MKKAKVIAFCNQKGGVAKTTTTFNLGARLVQLGNRVLLVDNDPQGNLTKYMGFDQEALMATMSDAILANINGEDIESLLIHHNENIDLIPADITLAFVSESLLTITDIETHTILKNILNKYIEQYDYILIDCAPALGILMKNALVAADSVVIPTAPSYGDIIGIEQLIQTVLNIKQGMNSSLDIEGILFTKAPKRTNLSEQTMEFVRESYSSLCTVFNSIIPIATKMAEAPVSGKSIFTHSPRSKVAQAYKDFCEEVINNA